MTTPERPRGARLDRWLGRCAVSAYRRPLAVVLAALLVVGLGLASARSLKLNADLTALLPGHFPSVRALEQLEQRAGATGYVVLVARDAPLSAARSFALAIAPRLEALPEIRYVDVRREKDWLLDHRLHFTDSERLQQFAERVEERVDRAVMKHNPLYFDLEDPLDEEETSEGAAGQFDLDSLQEGSQPAWLRHQTSGEYYESEAKGLLAVLARPVAQITNLQVASRTLEAVQRVVTELDPSSFHPKLKISVTGRYKKQADQKLQIQKDLALTSLVALGLVLAFLGLYFRRFLSLLHLGLPLLGSLVCTFGVVGATFGELNILTAFIGAILMGLGIDHGIHLLSSYRAGLREQLSPEQAIERAFSTTGKAVVVAALTTVAGFLGLALSEFRTFREFGIVASVGIVAVVIAYGFLLPSLLALLPSRPPRNHPATAAWRQLQRHPGRWLVGSLAIVLAALVPLSQLRFDYDFSALQDSNLPSFQLDREVNDLLGYSQTPTIVLAAGASEEQNIAQHLRQSSQAPASSTVDMAIALSDLIPNDPTVKATALGQIRRALARVNLRWLDDPEDRKAVGDLRAMAERPVPTRASVPVAIARQFGIDPGATKDDQGLLLVFPRVSMSEGSGVVRFAEQVRAAAGTAPVAGESMLLADILTTVRRESRSVLAVTAAGVFLALWLLLRNAPQAALAMTTASASLLAALGLSAALQWPLNYLNIVVIPVLFGVAVDGTVHLLEQRRAGQGLGHAVSAIFASLLTTGLGFGTLLLAHHPGLRSMGRLALLGLATNAVVSLVLLPGWFALRSAKLATRQAS